MTWRRGLELIQSPVAVSKLRRNLKTLFGPRLKLGVRKFGEQTPLKLLAVSERRCLVSEPCQIRAGSNHAVPKPVQVHRLFRLGHSDTDFISAPVALGIGSTNVGMTSVNGFDDYISEFYLPGLPRLLIQAAPVSSRAERMALS
jgi:hypothetical protein